MPVAVALSPHLDDAVFSAGGVLATLAASSWAVTILTVFTASVPDPQGFALACQLDKGLPADVDYMAIRRAEDRVACDILGARPQWLPLPEAPHRGYQSAADLFGAVRADDRIDLTRLIRAELDRLRPDMVLAPQGLGGHVDHVQLVSALRPMELARCVLWWRDFPYAAGVRARVEPFAEAMGDLPEQTVALGAEAAARKRQACLAYGSQIGFQFGGTDGLDRVLAAQRKVERFRLQADRPFSVMPGLDPGIHASDRTRRNGLPGQPSADLPAASPSEPSVSSARQ